MLIIKFSNENILYFFEEEKKRKKTVDLINMLNSRPEYFKKKFNKKIFLFIKKLREVNRKDLQKIDKNFDFSILNNFYEKNLWKNPEITECLKCIALEEILKKKKYSKVSLDIKDVRIYKFLKSNYIIEEINYRNKISVVSYYILDKLTIYFNILRSFFSFIKSIVLEFPLKKIQINNKSDNLYLTYSTIFKNNGLDDFFWNKLNLKNYKDSAKLIINSDNFDCKKKIEILKKEKNNKYEFVESYQSSKILYKTIYNWIGLIFIFFKFNSKYNKNPYFYSFLKNSLLSFSSIKNINLIYLFEVFFRKKKFTEVNYLFENLTWEKGLNKILGKKKNLNAYQHTSVREWDFRYSLVNEEHRSLDKYLPNKIYANSLISKKELKKSFLNSKIFKTNKSRFSYKNKNLKNLKIKKNRILLIADIEMSETVDMIKLLLNNLNKKFKVDIKLHPLNKNRNINFKGLSIVKNNLEKVIKNYKFIVCSNSTTSVYEVIKNKKIPFIYFNQNRLNLNPIKKMKNINYISTNKDVKNMITSKYKNKFNFIKFRKIYV